LSYFSSETSRNDIERDGCHIIVDKSIVASKESHEEKNISDLHKWSQDRFVLNYAILEPTKISGNAEEHETMQDISKHDSK
jgi:hypothetical protein